MVRSSFICFFKFFFLNKAPFKFSSDFANAWAAAGNSLAWQAGTGVHSSTHSAPSPGLGTREPLCQGTACELLLLEHSVCARRLAVQHRAATVTLCHAPLHRGIGNSRQDLLQISAAWALFIEAVTFREKSPWLLSTACSWVSVKATGCLLFLSLWNMRGQGRSYALGSACQDHVISKTGVWQAHSMHLQWRKQWIFGTWYGAETNEKLMCSC